MRKTESKMSPEPADFILIHTVPAVILRLRWLRCISACRSLC